MSIFLVNKHVYEHVAMTDIRIWEIVSIFCIALSFSPYTRFAHQQHPGISIKECSGFQTQLDCLFSAYETGGSIASELNSLVRPSPSLFAKRVDIFRLFKALLREAVYLLN